jgi:hypothetical protein
MDVIHIVLSTRSSIARRRDAARLHDDTYIEEAPLVAEIHPRLCRYGGGRRGPGTSLREDGEMDALRTDRQDNPDISDVYIFKSA